MTDISKTSLPKNEKTILGHPRGLFILFFTEMWERFSFYGMRALLILYLTQHFLFSDEKSNLLYGVYFALVYVMTIIGGTLADRYLGARKAVTFGAILLCFGHFGMAFEGSGAKQYLEYQGQQYQITLDKRGDEGKQVLISQQGKSLVTFNETDMIVQDSNSVGLPNNINRNSFTLSVESEKLYEYILYLSLALIIAGVGFLKANISTIVGSLYADGDKRRDSGFTIFYMGINLGAAASALLCGWLGVEFGWKYGFGLAGIGMLIGLFIFLKFQDHLEGKAEPPNVEILKEKVFLFIDREWLCYLTGLGIVIVSMIFVMNPGNTGVFLNVLGVLMLLGFIGYAFFGCVADERSKLLAALYFILAQIPFWALFEQAGSSLTLFTSRLVDREFLGITPSASQFQSLNAIFIVLFAPLLAWLWIWLDKRNLNPSTPVKFAFGVAFAGLGFLTLVAGIKGSGVNGLTPVLFIFLIYWIHTMGELLLSPVGLSAVTKLAPSRIVGLTMGAWFLYSGFSNYLAGQIARATSAETIGGQITNVAAAKAGYIEVYTQVGYIALGIALVMLLISPVIKKMMRGAD